MICILIYLTVDSISSSNVRCESPKPEHNVNINENSLDTSIGQRTVASKRTINHPETSIAKRTKMNPVQTKRTYLFIRCKLTVQCYGTFANIRIILAYFK